MSFKPVALVAVVVGVAAVSYFTLNASIRPVSTTASNSGIARAPAFEAHVVADGLIMPWAIGFLPDGRMLFTEHDGKVRLVRDEKLDPTPVHVVKDTKVWSKLGLMGLAIDPDFNTNHFVYLAEGYGTPRVDRDSWVRVVRYTFVDAPTPHFDSPTTLIEKIPGFWNHNGGRLVFGPDKTLHITTGDADQPPTAQQRGSLSGKILRVNRDGSPVAQNPFVSDSSALPVILSFGHRNPQGLAFRPGTNVLYETEHGPNGGDEINRIDAGANYGWPQIHHDAKADGMVSPLAEFTPSVAPASALFYDGAMFPELKGNLLVACLRGETVLRVGINDAGDKISFVERLVHQQFGRLREIAVGPDGAIWLTTSEIDEPDGRKRPGYDKLIKLTRGQGVAQTSALPDASSLPRPVGAVAIYAANCAACHGQTNAPGTQPAVQVTTQPGGAPIVPTSLFDREWKYGNDDNAIRGHIVNGIAERGMPAFGKLLTESEINELIGLIRIREQEHR